MNYLASPPVGGRLRAGWFDGHRHHDRVPRERHGGQSGLPAGHLAGSDRDRRRHRILDLLGHLRLRSTRTCSVATSAGRTSRRRRVTRSRGTKTPPTCASPPTSTACSSSRHRSRTSADARSLLKLGDSVTTDHISPAGAIKKDSPAGEYLLDNGVDARDFNSLGSRRGNHEVMIRGTFANIRLRNQIAPGTEGGFTRDFTQPDGPVTTVFEAVGGLPGRGHAARRPGGQGVRLGLVARLGGQGHSAAGRQGRHRRVV